MLWGLCDGSRSFLILFPSAAGQFVLSRLLPPIKASQRLRNKTGDPVGIFIIDRLYATIINT